jgi:hypothetical protein
MKSRTRKRWQILSVSAARPTPSGIDFNARHAPFVKPFGSERYSRYAPIRYPSTHLVDYGQRIAYDGAVTRTGETDADLPGEFVDNDLRLA